MERDKKDILNDICDIYVSLSPENLSYEGEISAKESKKRGKELSATLAELFQEYGERISETEAFKRWEVLTNQ